jgi:hypothetical protein
VDGEVRHVELNKTHTGDQFPEKHRVVSDGGRVTAGVVNGRGKATRALGVLSPGQVPHPDVRTVKLDPERVCAWPPDPPPYHIMLPPALSPC